MKHRRYGAGVAEKGHTRHISLKHTTETSEYWQIWQLHRPRYESVDGWYTTCGLLHKLFRKLYPVQHKTRLHASENLRNLVKWNRLKDSRSCTRSAAWSRAHFAKWFAQLLISQVGWTKDQSYCPTLIRRQTRLVAPSGQPRSGTENCEFPSSSVQGILDNLQHMSRSTKHPTPCYLTHDSTSDNLFLHIPLYWQISAFPNELQGSLKPFVLCSCVTPPASTLQFHS